jgi:TRAP-type C4-dicarboxylate transport system permease small subunit
MTQMAKSQANVPSEGPSAGMNGNVGWVSELAKGINWLAAASIMGMMLLTTADVILRYFRHPIPGTYEIVGFMGSVAVGFALASTSLQRGHVAVSILFDRLPREMKGLVGLFNALVAAVFFSILTWQLILLASDLKETGEVSMTLEMPFYPFVYGISAGSGVLAMALFAEAFVSIRGWFRR